MGLANIIKELSLMHITIIQNFTTGVAVEIHLYKVRLFCKEQDPLWICFPILSLNQ